MGPYEFPRVTELECQGCVMTGGHDVGSEAEAEAYSSLLDRPVAVGEHVEEAPCVPEHTLAKLQEELGRPCPRVELEPENRPALNLVGLSLQPHLQHLFDSMCEATCADLTPEEQRAFLMRVATALDSEAVRARQQPPAG